jgi:hypothetical protein
VSRAPATNNTGKQPARNHANGARRLGADGTQLILAQTTPPAMAGLVAGAALAAALATAVLRDSD